MYSIPDIFGFVVRSYDSELGMSCLFLMLGLDNSLYNTGRWGRFLFFWGISVKKVLLNVNDELLV